MYFMRPKAATRDNAQGMINVEVIAVVDDYENEYIPVTGFDSSVNGLSAAVHRRDPTRSEAAPGSPLPGGSWRG